METTATFKHKTLKIASPCSESWEKMTGDERTRQCARCMHKVHNLAGLNEKEIEELLTKNGERICVRMYVRKDGTVITKDCPVGVAFKFKLRVICASLLTCFGLGAYFVNSPRLKCHPLMGKIAPSSFSHPRAVMGEMVVAPPSK